MGLFNRKKPSETFSVICYDQYITDNIKGIQTYYSASNSSKEETSEDMGRKYEEIGIPLENAAKKLKQQFSKVLPKASIQIIVR